MSIDDDYFDVRDALKDKPEAESVDRLIDYINALELENSKLKDVNSSLKTAYRVATNTKYL